MTPGITQAGWMDGVWQAPSSLPPCRMRLRTFAKEEQAPPRPLSHCSVKKA